MRLRVRIQRHELPTVNTLWPINDSQRRHTIAHLLHQINAVFPLEADSWGLEHYVVTVGGYECLHYHELGAACKDEDEVLIRPMQFAELKARTLLGRDQISIDGRHLYDGLPFGRPLLKGVVRPQVSIPPRKKVRIRGPGEGSGDEARWDEEGDTTRLLEYDGKHLQGHEDALEPDMDVSDEDDGDFKLGESDEDEGDTDEDDEDESDGDESDEDEAGLSSMSSSEDESESDDSEPDDTTDSSDTSDTSDDDHVVPVSPTNLMIELQTPRPKPGVDEPVTRRHGQISPPKIQSEIVQSVRQPSVKDNAASSTKEPKFVGIPNQGKQKTWQRNMRRRGSRRLKHLKAEGELPADASLADMRIWQAQRIQSDQAKSTTANGGLLANDRSLEERSHTGTQSTIPIMEGKASTDHAVDVETQRQRLLNDIAAGGVDVTTKLDLKKKRGISDVDSDSNDDEDAPEVLSTKQLLRRPDGQTTPATSIEQGTQRPSLAEISKATDMIPTSVARRSKLDIASSKRLLFGSLGVRVPKSQEDKDMLQKKLMLRSIRPAIVAPSPAGTADAVTGQSITNELSNDVEDPDAWRDRIDLNAIECCEENVTLSTPPFPFYQRWDPQQRSQKQKKFQRIGSTYMAPRKRQKVGPGGSRGNYVESYDKYNADGGGDALEYDDVSNEDEAAYWEEGALIRAEDEYEYDDESDDAAARQLLAENAKQEEADRQHQREGDDDGFPALPTTDHLSELPILIEADAKQEDYVVYQELVCSAATSWQPQTLTRTARLQARPENGEDAWKVVLAPRDRRPRDFDPEGNRVYAKFEMAGFSDAEDEEESEGGERSVRWEELGVVRLLSRPVSCAAGD